MKRSTLLILIPALLLVASLAAAQGGQQGAAGASCSKALLDRLETLPIEPISETEQAAVVTMREEEKLAHDVYATLALKWDIPIFTNIARAEQRHMELMAALLDRNGIADPVADESIGSFTDPKMGELFTSLVEKGESSLEQALRVGATIEDMDLADLAEMMDASDNRDIKLVGNNLAKGSRNHLRAFSKVLSKKGFDAYTAQYLDQDRVDEIIASQQERRIVYDENGEKMAGWDGGKGNCMGRGQGQGKCMGKGQGNGQGACKGKGNGQGKGMGRGQGKGKGCGRGSGQGQGGGPGDGSCIKTG